MVCLWDIAPDADGKIESHSPDLSSFLSAEGGRYMSVLFTHNW